ncbi:MAG: hypothetical protein RLZZ08_55 [Pseudomonadota bacterium]|jgi:hypothetical protein
MIRATLNGADGLAARLASHAAQIAAAAAESSLRARRADPLRWRMAGLLWPLFTKD